ncbi:MAG: hypothetical protein WBD87_01600 [Candidatus Acidiferrales bacterium]
MKPKLKLAFAVGILGVLTFAPSANAKTLKTTALIVQRNETRTAYWARIPGSSQTNCTATTNGTATADTIVTSPNTASTNINGTANTTGNCSQTVVPGVVANYSVNGANFVLLLPDGRLVAVGCNSKHGGFGALAYRRSCREPLVDTIDVEFDGDKAKLIWVVSLDGKKKESETYAILGIKEAPTTTATK